MQQEGIYYASGETPAAAFGVLFLQADPETTKADVGALLEQLWAVYRGLKNGLVPDLPGETVNGGELTVLIGYGLNVFNRRDIAHPAPRALRDYGRFKPAQTSGGGTLLAGSGLRYAPYISKNKCTEDIAVQFIGDTELAVNRAFVETWKLFEDTLNATGKPAALSIASFFRGFQRDDGRSWIDFHDGISNLPSEQRGSVITVKPSNDPREAWLTGGTYMVYMRIAVDLQVWRRIPPLVQEELVGRAKVSGCPLVSASPAGVPQPVAGCPFSDQRHPNFRETPIQVDGRIAQSHVQRANHHQQPLDDPSSARIFRQGYEFLETTEQAPGFRLGLNFVSFQDTPQRLNRILSSPTWLGGTNFGGPVNAENTNAGMDRLLEIIGAGVFAVPPDKGEPYPGYELFNTSSSPR